MVTIDVLDTTAEVLTDGRPLSEYEDNRFDIFNLDDERPSESLWESYCRADSQAIYANPNGQDANINGLRPRTIRVCKFVEAQAGKKYTIRVKFGPDFPYKDSSVYVRMFVDGYWADGFTCSMTDLNKRFGHSRTSKEARYYVGRERGAKAIVEDYVFGPLTISDEDVVGRDNTGQAERWIGTIRVLMWRSRTNGSALSRPAESKPMSAKNCTYREKKMKKAESATLGTNFENGRKTNDRCFTSKRIYIDGGPSNGDPSHFCPPENVLGHPFADFTFKYRDRRSLQALGLIERDPSPDEPDEREDDAVLRRNKVAAAAARRVADATARARTESQRRTYTLQEDGVEFAPDLERSGNQASQPITVLPPDQPGDTSDLAIHIADSDDELAVPSIENDRTGLASVYDRSRRQRRIAARRSAMRRSRGRSVSHAGPSTAGANSHAQRADRSPSPLFHDSNVATEAQQERMNEIEKVRNEAIAAGKATAPAARESSHQ